MTEKGHEDWFPTARVGGRCRLGKGTFAGAHSNGREMRRFRSFTQTGVL